MQGSSQTQLTRSKAVAERPRALRIIDNLAVHSFQYNTRRALGGAHVPPTKVFRRLTDSVNKTTVKPRVAAADNTYTLDFLNVKFRVPVSALIYDSGESSPVPASRL